MKERRHEVVRESERKAACKLRRTESAPDDGSIHFGFSTVTYEILIFEARMSRGMTDRSSSNEGGIAIARRRRDTHAVFSVSQHNLMVAVLFKE